jgi:hypothetical protein
MKRVPTIRIALVLFSLLCTGGALADDGKIYAGITCKQDGTSGTLARFGGNAVNVSSTQSLQVICPLTQDGASIAAFFGYFWDRNPNASVACSVVTESPQAGAGNVIQFFGTSSTTVAANSVSATLGTVSGAQAVGNYSYAICVIPPTTASGASGVLMMQISEGGAF